MTKDTFRVLICNSLLWMRLTCWRLNTRAGLTVVFVCMARVWTPKQNLDHRAKIACFMDEKG